MQQVVSDSDVRVLLGDSTPSELPPDVLDLITEVIDCVRDVAMPYTEIEDLEKRRREAADVAEAIIAELTLFAKQTEVGMRATSSGASRPEVRAHGEEAVAALQRLVSGWQRQHEGRRDSARAQMAQRITALRESMLDAVERFLVPRRVNAPVQRFHRFFDGQRYLDTAVVEPLKGIRVMLSLTDPEPEAPRRIRSLIGKVGKIQVGTRLSRIRKIPEAVTASIDDQVILDAERGPGRLRVMVAKKAGIPETTTIEMGRSDDGLLHARVQRAEEQPIDSPPSDLAILETLWTAMDAERERIMACPAQLVELVLDGRRVEDSDAMVSVAERLLDAHRSTISLLALHSPNPAELTIKIERDGKREEAWVRRDDLGQHLIGLPDSLRRRLNVPELTGDDTEDLMEVKTAVHHQILSAQVDDDHSMPIALDPADLEPAGAPRTELVEDLSLSDLVVDDDSEASGCIELTRVNRR